MDINLKGKRALVCGASQGMGLAIAQQLATQGADVVVMARNKASLQQAVDTLSNDGTQEHQFLIADFEYL